MKFFVPLSHQVEYDKEQKGPISAIEHVQGFLVTAMGQKVSK